MSGIMLIIDITAHVVNTAGSWLTDSVISNVSQYSEYWEKRSS